VTSKASKEWLQSFRKQHQIVFNEVCAESGEETLSNSVVKLPSVMDGYKLNNIANSHKTGLFFVNYQAKTLSLKGEKCSSGKLCKESLTVFFCGFMAREMEKPLVTGKAVKSRCFMNADIKNFPIGWKSIKKAWITSPIMEEWLRAFNVQR
jgi:hypothetical protein